MDGRALNGVTRNRKREVVIVEGKAVTDRYEIWCGNGLLHAGTAQDETDAELRAAMSDAVVEGGRVLAGGR